MSTEEALPLLRMRVPLDEDESNERDDLPGLLLLRSRSVERTANASFVAKAAREMFLKPPMEARLRWQWRGKQPPLVYFVFLASFGLAMDQNLMAPNLSVSLRESSFIMFVQNSVE